MISQVLTQLKSFKFTKNKDSQTHPNPVTKEGDGVIFASSYWLIKLRRWGEQLELKISNALAMQAGVYQSSFKGRGMEFNEARPYQAGDDVRSLDWRVTARTGKPYTKLFREERERPVLVCVDFRRTMFFATRGKFKSVCAAEIAAIIGWCAAHQGDRLGGLFFSENDHTEIRPQRGKTAVLHFIKGLENESGRRHNHQGRSSHSRSNHGRSSQGRSGDNQSNNEPDSSPASLQNALMRIRRVARPGSMIFVVSDFRNFDDQAESHLTYLTRHNEVILLCINDPLERELPNSGIYRFKDENNIVTIDTSINKLREQYRSEYLQKMDRLKRFSLGHRVHFATLSTTDDVSTTLSKVLRKKK